MHLPQELQHLEMLFPLPVCAFQYSTRRTSHSTAEQERREQNKLQVKSLPGKCWEPPLHSWQGFLQRLGKAGEQRPAPETNTAQGKHRDSLQVLPAHPAPDLETCPTGLPSQTFPQSAPR